MLEAGDRVMLKPWFHDSVGDMSSTKEFGPEANLAVGTVTTRTGSNSVYVLWDDPSYISDHYGEPGTQWSEHWFNRVGRLDVSEPDKIEAFLNGR